KLQEKLGLLKLQEKLGALQEEKHQLFLQLKKVLHEEEKRDLTTLTAAAYPQGLGVPGAHLLGMTGSPGGPRSGLIGADRAKQMFGPPVISVSLGAFGGIWGKIWGIWAGFWEVWEEFREDLGGIC
uniref:Uncharacterized protein n=1 Tax=Geospiza parvula TaxID=87175 RepID=A0A8U8BHW4_GEOPR